MPSVPGATPDAAGQSVAVVICTRNRPVLLAGALTAVSAAVRHDDEVVVVDSASDTPETAKVATEAGFRVLRLDRPGSSRARNAGAAATTAPLVAFTDDDCLPAPGWTTALAVAFADPGVGLVFGRVVGEASDDGTPFDDPGDEPFSFSTSDDPSTYGVGACMALRREALDGVGGWDEALGPGTRLRGGEDHDLAWRVLGAGWTGQYQPAARVVHREWRDPWQLVRRQWTYGLGAGAVATKLIRVDRRRGWRVLARRIGPEGLGQMAYNLARRWERPALGSLLFTCGVVTGALRSWRRPSDSRQ